MKLSYKAFIITGATCIVLFGLTLIPLIRNSFIISAVIFIFSFSLLFTLFYLLLINRVKKLSHAVENISSTSTFNNKIKINGEDEINLISDNINTMLDIIKMTQEQFMIRDKEQQRELQYEIEKRSHREYLSKLSRYDITTALPNRIFFNEILNKSINHAKRRKKVIAILLIDIDSFKNELLQEIGKRFEATLRAEDILAKLDGGEFIILLNDIAKPKFAGTVAEKLLRCCSEISLTASIGICIYPNDGDSLESLLNNVDLALYSAKHNTKGDYQFYTPALNIEAHEYIQLESSLRKAIQNHELTLYYQPKLHIKQGIITGVEALIRWEHPDLGIINPQTFLPVAEETCMIIEIGEWALLQACRMNKQWQDQGYEHLTIALNLSPKQFHHPNIINTIKKALIETGLNPKYLELEISENTIMDNVESAKKILSDIKAMGVQLSIDHFGTGYTSISSLKQLPISILKIDKSFIKGIPNNSNDIAITNAFIALAHNLGMEVVAEGVETAEQVQYLSGQQCDVIQGYFISHPLPADKIVLQFKKLMEGVL